MEFGVFLKIMSIVAFWEEDHGGCIPAGTCDQQDFTAADHGQVVKVILTGFSS